MLHHFCLNNIMRQPIHHHHYFPINSPPFNSARSYHYRYFH